MPKALAADGQYDEFYAPIRAFDNGKNGDGLIYFAGEAFSKNYSGYTHGAYLSGESVACNIINGS